MPSLPIGSSLPCFGQSCRQDLIQGLLTFIVATSHASTCCKDLGGFFGVFRAHIEWFLLGGGEMLPTFLTFLALLLLQNFSQESNGGTIYRRVVRLTINPINTPKGGYLLATPPFSPWCLAKFYFFHVELWGWRTTPGKFFWMNDMWWTQEFTTPPCFVCNYS